MFKLSSIHPGVKWPNVRGDSRALLLRASESTVRLAVRAA